jgi:hypothetical protein
LGKPVHASAKQIFPEISEVNAGGYAERDQIRGVRENGGCRFTGQALDPLGRNRQD